MDEILWCVKWSAFLAPDLSMIPDRSVFLRSTSGRSLTATVDDVTGSIWDAKEDKGNAADERDAEVVGDVEAVEELCYCSMHEPGLENKVSQDQVLFV